MDRIGIAGVGLMGHGIALNVLRGGWPLVYLDHPGNQPVEDLAALGATGVASGRALAEECTIVLLCVTGSPQVEDVLTREDGVLAGLRPNATVIDCSTSVPATTARMAARVASAGGRFLDAPMTRTPKEAAEGRLNLIVGGEAALLEAHRPLLESFAENIFHAGPIGAGHTMKLMHNFVSLGFATLLAEAAAAANTAGIAPEAFHEVLARGGGGGAALDRLAPYVLRKDPSGLRFTLSNALKDLSYYTEMCDDLGAQDGIAEAIRAMLGGQVEAGNGADLIPALVDLLAQD
ncbi:MAG: NAD(P)-dependent oxidoreductase [Pseudomonadota bacterium]